MASPALPTPLSQGTEAATTPHGGQQQAQPDPNTTAIPNGTGSNHQAVNPETTNMQVQSIGGSTLDIVWALTCLSLPMLVLTAIFLGLVYGYEISSNPDASTDLLGRISSISDGSAYYVDYSATRLATVSSWTSTAISFTTTFIMVLVSYPLAKNFMRRSKSGVIDSLPTAYQFNLIIGLLQGGLGPLWEWFRYSVWKGRSKQTGLLWIALVTAVGGIFFK
jgi:hypothetical protein